LPGFRIAAISRVEATPPILVKRVVWTALHRMSVLVKFTLSIQMLRKATVLSALPPFAISHL